jgi:hypothetical protein
MGLNTLGILDISVITDVLTKMLGQCYDQSPMWTVNGGDIQKFTLEISGSAPDAVRSLSHCQLSLYLFHVSQDPYQRNSPVLGPRARTIPAQPLSLDLYYLLSACSQSDYHQEQQAMSIALKCFHETPIVRTNVLIPVPPPTSQPEEFTLTMEVETLDTLSRLWQSTANPMRLAAIYKVSVVFVTPPTPAVPLANPVQPRGIGIAVDPATFPLATNGQLIGTYRKITYTSPNSSATNPDIVSYDSSAATVAAGQTLILYGSSLSDGNGNHNPTAKRLYLIPPGGIGQEVTNWIVPDPNPTPPPLTHIVDSRLTVQLQAPFPDPGVYQLAVGSDTSLGDPAYYRSNTVPISIAAAISGMPAPPAAPVLGANTFDGTGFVSGKTEVLLGSFPLTEAPPANGTFQITGGTKIDFQPLSGLPHGLYAVRVRVNQVESDPSWWVSI